MKQSLIKRIRNALSYDDFDDIPLVGNYFIKDNYVLEIDEIPLNDSFEVNYGVMGRGAHSYATRYQKRIF